MPWKTARCLGVSLIVAGVLNGLGGAMVDRAHAAGGELEIRTVDENGQLTPARMHLRDEQGRPVRVRDYPYWNDHFVFPGKAILKLKTGTYRFEIERGPEYRTHHGHFIIEPNAGDNHEVALSRFVDMKSEGWWSGDLHIHRSPDDIELLMRAEDLHVAPVITWWNDNNHWAERGLPEHALHQYGEHYFAHLLAGEDEREGGALLYFNLEQPLAITGASREYPSPVEFLKLARKSAATPESAENGESGDEPPVNRLTAGESAPLHVDIEKPFWWDMPIWVASGMTHSIGVANNHLQRDEMLSNEAWGKPRERITYPDPHGNGRWSQAIYFHLLNCGVRMPPSAGSASGVLKNPVGYNRVYVHCGDDFSYANWWAGLRAGRVVITNGPLLRPEVNGELPGHVFTADAGQSIELIPALKLSTKEKIAYLEVIRNGEVVDEVRLEDYARAGGRLPPVTFNESGWLVIRAVTNNPKTFRFAMTGPYYVQIGYQPRISRASAQFFLDWVTERARRLKLDDPKQHAEVLRYHRAARDFWQAKLEAANAP
ncbi:MAG: CehA/McbA family metallohydrolase [Pirellulaceae bacterium]